MASLPSMFGAAATGRVITTRATKGGNAKTEEKSFVDWLLGKITKEDQFYETDPILQGTEVKSGGTTSGRKSTVSVQPKKKNNNNNGNESGGGGVFKGLFAKKQ